MQERQEVQKQLHILTDKVGELNNKLDKRNSFFRNFLMGIVNGIGTAIGATLLAGILLAILSNVIDSIDDIPILNTIIESIDIDAVDGDN